MPPKLKGKSGKNVLEESANLPNPASFVRPATPNDFQIVATVRTLQQLVNTEVKWKNRVLEAQRLNQITLNKVIKMRGLIKHAQQGIQLLNQEVNDIINSCFLVEPKYTALVALDGHAMQSPILAQMSSSANNMPDNNGRRESNAEGLLPNPDAMKKPAEDNTKKKSAGGKSGASGGHGSGGENDPSFITVTEANYSISTFERRRQEAEVMGTILRSYYQLPRMQKEEILHPVQRPTSPLEMQKELNEAMRLSTPTAELIAQAHERSLTGSQIKKGSGGAAGRAKSLSHKPPVGKGGKLPPGKGGSKGGGHDNTTNEDVDEASIGDLRPQDFLSLPLPRGVDHKLFQRILTLRSRKIRLENSISIFENEINPLERRMAGVSEMMTLTNYSLGAVQPKIQYTVGEEAELQKTRQKEDDEFMAEITAAKRAHTPGGPTGVTTRK